MTHEVLPVQGHECLSACLGNVFHMSVPGITGNEVVIAGKGCGLMYDVNRRVVDTPMYEANFNFLEKYHIDYQHGKVNENIQPQDFLNDCLEKNGHMIIKVDAAQLPYSRVFDQTTSAPHFLNILKYGEKNYRICDGYVPTRKAEVYVGDLDEKLLLEVWGQKNYEYLIIRGDFDELNQVSDDVRQELLETLVNYSKGGHDENFYYGKDAIVKAFTDFGEEFTKDRAIELNYQLRIFGFLSTKEMVCSFLKKDSRLIEFSEEYEKIINVWDRLIMKFLKIVIAQKPDRLEGFYAEIHECINVEINLLNRIIKEGLS